MWLSASRHINFISTQLIFLILSSFSFCYCFSFYLALLVKNWFSQEIHFRHVRYIQRFFLIRNLLKSLKRDFIVTLTKMNTRIIRTLFTKCVSYKQDRLKKLKTYHSSSFYSHTPNPHVYLLSHTRQLQTRTPSHPYTRTE